MCAGTHTHTLHCDQGRCPIHRATLISSSPSVRRAFPPVGTHRTVLQLVHTTTVWEWLNTVVLRRGGVGMGSKG